MARLIPNHPTGTVSPATARVFRLLRLLSDDFTVWQSLGVRGREVPEFFVLGPENKSLLLKVCTATDADIRAAQQRGLWDAGAQGSSGVEFAHPERAVVKNFVAGVQPIAPAGKGTAEDISAALLFPGAARKRLRDIFGAPSLPDMAWAGKEDLAPARFPRWIRRHLGGPLDSSWLEALRTAYAPESVIPIEFCVREPPRRGTEAELTHYLFDYDQEWALKLDLQPPEEPEPEHGNVRLRLVNGVAGSGKSLLLVYRAHLLMHLRPDAQILLLTHNRPLSRDLKARYLRLAGRRAPTPWVGTFLGWCRSLWPEEWVSPIGMGQRNGIAARLVHEHFWAGEINPAQFLSEIDWFKDRQLSTREEYLSADRRGRGFALDERRRSVVFDAMLAYEQELRRLGRPDWGDVPRRLWGFLQEHRLRTRCFDAILVDEAQFFAPLWFDILREVLNNTNGQLYLAADPTQGFLKRRQSWLASGLDVRGRSVRLARSYRTTRAILSFATFFYSARLVQDDDDIVEPDLLDMPAGVIPVLVPLTSRQDEITRVANEVASLIQLGVHKEHILCIHAGWQGVGRLIEQIDQRLGMGSAIDGRTSNPGDAIRVCTLNSSTGLESPIVFLSGTHVLFDEEQSLRISDDERVELIRDNTRRLYMAMTRAGQRLMVTYVGELPEPLQRVVALAGTPQPGADLSVVRRD